MSIPLKYLATLEENTYYHIYNRTNNRELLFRSDENYRYFLKLYTKYLRPLCQTYSWCLLPNHFHFLIRVRAMETLLEHIRSLPDTNRLASAVLDGATVSTHQIVANAFQKLFTAYAMGFNNAWERSGNLFHRPFKRLLVENEEQLMSTAIYIHTNPKHHKLTTCFEDYSWSSYRNILGRPEVTEPAYLLQLFGGKDGYVAAHQNRADDLPWGAIED